MEVSYVQGNGMPCYYKGQFAFRWIGLNCDWLATLDRGDDHVTTTDLDAH